MERFAASRRPQAEKVGVVRQFVFPFFSRNVNGHRHALPVRIVNLQRRVLAVLYFFLVHQTGGGIAQRQEAVILRTHAVTVSRKRIDEQFQLVVSPLGDMDAHTSERVFQMIGGLLQVGITVAAHHQVVVRID